MARFEDADEANLNGEDVNAADIDAGVGRGGGPAMVGDNPTFRAAWVCGFGFAAAVLAVLPLDPAAPPLLLVSRGKADGAAAADEGAGIGGSCGADAMDAATATSATAAAGTTVGGLLLPIPPLTAASAAPATEDSEAEDEVTAAAMRLVRCFFVVMRSVVVGAAGGASSERNPGADGRGTAGVTIATDGVGKQNSWSNVPRCDAEVRAAAVDEVRLHIDAGEEAAPEAEANAVDAAAAAVIDEGRCPLPPTRRAFDAREWDVAPPG